MARTHKNLSTVFNNYIMIPFIAKEAVGNGDPDEELASIPFPARFRVSHIQKFLLGGATTVNLQFRNNTTNVAMDPLAVMVAGTVSQHTTDALVQPARTIEKGQVVSLRGATDGSGTIVAGGAQGIITGYFTEPINNKARFAEPGQQAGDRPAAGYYCILPFRNARASANQALRVEASIIAPFDCRIMAITTNVLGHDDTTGAITMTFKNATTTNIISALALDANPEYCIDSDSGTSWVADVNRDVTRGDQLDVQLATGASDIVPIGTHTMNALVWVKGHVNVDPGTDD